MYKKCMNIVGFLFPCVLFLPWRGGRVAKRTSREDSVALPCSIHLPRQRALGREFPPSRAQPKELRPTPRRLLRPPPRLTQARLRQEDSPPAYVVLDAVVEAALVALSTLGIKRAFSLATSCADS